MSISLENPRLLVISLLPTNIEGVIKKLEENNKYAEKHMCDLTLLITNIVLGAIKALEQGNYKSFDANPGDGGCQIRALELRRLVQVNLKEECSLLKQKTSDIQKSIRIRKNNSHKPQDLFSIFFQEHFSKLYISQEMEYILHCYLSAMLRTRYHTYENGVQMTRSDVSQLSKLSKNIDTLDGEFRKKIVQNNQKMLSILSVALIRDSANKIISLELKEKELLIAMLSKKHTHIFTPDKNFEPKAFGCLFYQIKALLIRLKEEKGLVCLKSIVPKGKQPFYLFLQSPAPKEEFKVLSEQDKDSLLPSSLVVIFEAIVDVEKREALEHLEQYGFSDMVLFQAAKEAPYEPGSTVDDIKRPEAVSEIIKYQQKEVRNFFTLDHVYLNRLDRELK